MPDGGIQITLRDKRWREAVPHVRALAKKAVSAVLDLTKTEVSLVFADDDFVHELNRVYRGKDKPTNVLSFPSPDSYQDMDIWLAGDIVVAYETLTREAAEQGKSIEAHLTHLLVHGSLHLKGYDHILEQEADAMEAVEKEIMARLGYANPYLEREE